MKTKIVSLIGGIILLLIIGWLFVRFVIGGDEDSWIKDEKGVWTAHGNPTETPNYVTVQQEAIECALNLYNMQVKETLSSQCLGTCGGAYAVDIVHVPRNTEDNLPENQCEDYREGKVTHFIELDKEGNVVRIV
jgi:hypothetical protein